MLPNEFPIGIYMIDEFGSGVGEEEGISVYYEHDKTQPDIEHSMFSAGQTFSVFEVIEENGIVWGRISDYKNKNIPDHWLPLRENENTKVVFIQAPIF